MGLISMIIDDKFSAWFLYMYYCNVAPDCLAHLRIKQPPSVSCPHVHRSQHTQGGASMTTMCLSRADHMANVGMSAEFRARMHQEYQQHADVSLGRQAHRHWSQAHGGPS